MSHNISYLADGRLFITAGGDVFSEVESEFARKARQTEQEIVKKKEWKTSGSGAQFMGISARVQASDLPSMKTDVNGVAWSHTRGGLVYSLETSAVGGLFLYTVGDRSEQRLFHREYTGIRELDCHTESGRIVCAVYGSMGESNIALVNENCTGAEHVTEGDSIDGMPRWIPGTRASVVYHSAGIARTREGVYSGTGNFSILRLDMERGEISTVIEDPRYDFMLPYIDASGNLFCVRRKWVDGIRSGGAGILSTLRDMIMFPFGVIRTLINFLNWKSIIYSNKPLITAGTNQTQDVNRTAMLILGRVVDIRKKAVQGNDGGLVPKDWELIRVDRSGVMSTIAKGVVSYDISPNGDVYYTNGKSIFRAKGVSGTSEKIAERPIVETLRVFPSV